MVESGSFVEMPESGYVLLARDVDSESNTLYDVFLRKDQPNRVELVTAEQARFNIGELDSRSSVEFQNGYTYLLDLKNQRDITQKFGTMVIYFEESNTRTRYRRKAEPTVLLADSSKPKDVAELQWRFSTPLATTALALLAVPLARSGPRQSRIRGTVMGIAVYTIFFALASVARSMVEDATVPPMPGIWWSYAFPVLLLLTMLVWPRIRLLATRR